MNTLIFLSIVVAALGLQGCGGKVKPAKKQQSAELKLPDYESKGKAPFMLTDDQGELLYKANLLFWDPGVTPSAIEKVADASVKGRHVRADFLRFLKEEKAPTAATLASRQAEAKEIDVAVIKARIDNFDKIVDLQKPLLTGWLSSRLSELGQAGTLSAAEVTAAQSQFEVYCQAKLWETAVNSLLGQKYASRPTPLIMCESYYGREGVKLLDKSTPACADAAAGSKKNYLECFWKEGVLKTAMFAARGDLACSTRAGAPKKNDQILAWVASGELLSALAADFADTTGSTNRVVDAVLTDKNIGQTYAFAQTCPAAFKMKSTTVLLQTPLIQLLNIVEYKLEASMDTTSFLVLLPRRDTDDDAKTAERYALVANDLRTFAVRLGGPSVNDRIFNNDAAHSVREAIDIRAQYDAAPGFAKVRQVETDYVPADLQERKTSVVADIASLTAKLDSYNQETSTDAEGNLIGADGAETALNRRLTAVLGEGGSASMADGVSELFLPFTLKVARQADSVTVRLQMRSGRGALGCLNLDGSACVVEPGPNETDWSTFASLGFNPDNNELDLDLGLDDPAAQGLIFDATSTMHNLIPTEELKGRVLRLNAYANKLDDLLDFFTGKAQLLDDGKVEREGSISGDAYGSDAALWQ